MRKRPKDFIIKEMLTAANSIISMTDTKLKNIEKASRGEPVSGRWMRGTAMTAIDLDKVVRKCINELQQHYNIRGLE